MKILNPLLIIFLFPVFGFAQSLNGVFTGVLSNDSTTVRRDQSFEMALTEYKGKVYGYAYSTFIVNDTLYYIVKRVKGNVEGDICEVEDDEVISHNFPQKPEKKVFVTYTLRRNAADSVWRLDGNWKTNLTKKYYAISGKVETKEEKDLSKSKLYEHLGDLDLQKTLAFTKPKEPEKKPEKTKDDKADIAKNAVKKEGNKNTVVAETKTADKRPEAKVAKVDTKATTNLPQNNHPANQVTTSSNTVPEKKPETNGIQANAKIPENKTTIPANNPVTNNVGTVSANTIEKKPENISGPNPSPVTTNNQPAQSNNIAKTDTRIPDNKTNNVVNNVPKQEAKKDIATPGTPPVDNKQTDKKLVSVAVDYKAAPVNNNNVSKSPPLDKKSETSIAKQENKIPDQKTNPVSTNSPVNQNEKKDVAASQKKPDAEFEFKDLKKTDRKLKPAATLVDGRVTIPSETIFFKSDSLSIALYDNGEVDGDSVSVIINDEMFIEKQGLKSSAFKKTYYVPRTESDSLLVVLYADNLGKYPPNTGLLQIKDGEEIFYVRFKADLDRNAAIVLRRKSKL